MDHSRYKQIASYSNGSENTICVGGLLEKAIQTVSGVTTKYYRHYIPTPSGVAIIVSRNDDFSTTSTYALSDHLGSTDAVLDKSGALLVRESFTAFGARRGSNWTGLPSMGDATAYSGLTRHGFTGQEMLDNVSLSHFGGRVYDPVIGRFLSADPLVQDLGISQSLNRYSYTWNNPLTFIDPSGFDVCVSTTIVRDSDNIERLVPYTDQLCLQNLQNYLNNLSHPATGAPALGIPIENIKMPTLVLQQQTLPPCETFADDVAARKANAEQLSADEALTAVATTNDIVGSSLDVASSVQKIVGKVAPLIETGSRVATGASVVFIVNDYYQGFRFGKSDSLFDASYGTTGLVTGLLIDPMIPAGMLAASAVDKVLPKPPSLLEQSIAKARPQCTPRR